MRAQGWDLVSIGAALDPPVSYQRVAALIKQALERTVAQSVGEMRELEGVRLDQLQVGHYEKACDGDVYAGGMVLGILKQRAALFGLNVQPSEGVPTGGTLRIIIEGGLPRKPGTKELVDPVKAEAERAALQAKTREPDGQG